MARLCHGQAKQMNWFNAYKDKAMNRNLYKNAVKKGFEV